MIGLDLYITIFIVILILKIVWLLNKYERNRQFHGFNHNERCNKECHYNKHVFTHRYYLSPMRLEYCMVHFGIMKKCEKCSAVYDADKDINLPLIEPNFK